MKVKTVLPLIFLLSFTFFPTILGQFQSENREQINILPGETKGTSDRESISTNSPEQITNTITSKEFVPEVLKEELIKKGETTNNFYLTFYGFPDNDPPGRAIAYQKKYFPESIHNEAGGIGTFTDPVTAAAKKGIWPVGTKFYLPFLKKYVILEDICASCKEFHLDVWMESNANFVEELYQCQREWTRKNVEVEINPPSERQVNTTVFFDVNSGQCNKF